MPINTPAQLKEYLESQGYAPKLSADSVFVPVGGSEAPYTAAFTFNKAGHLQITCQLAVLGDFPESQLAQLSLAALDANMQISPFAFAVIGAAVGSDVDIDHCPVVLIDTVPTSDLSQDEIDYALERLLQALTLSSDILKLGLASAK
jgi:hypothetical protein